MLHLLLLGALLQQPVPPQQPQTPAPAAQPEQAPTPKGQVVFERHSTDEPAPAIEPEKPQQPVLHPRISSSNPEAGRLAITDAMRTAIRIAGYDLDLHLNFDKGTVETRARLKITNTSGAAISLVPLQISSSLQWESAQQDGKAVPLQQHQLETDTDHTGTATEVAFTLATPLEPGGTTQLDLFYSGTLVESADRLIALGANDAQASVSEWDGFNPAQPVSGIRGFGNVLWYPVAAVPAHFGDGNKLLMQVAEARVAQRDVPFHLRVTAESAVQLYSAVFCGQTKPLTPLTSDSTAAPFTTPPPAGTPHLATAEWTLPHIGLRSPSLFLTTVEANAPNSGLIAAFTDRPDTVAGYNAAAMKVRALMQTWFGAQPLQNLTLLDLGARNALPFEDGAVVALPMRVKDSDELTPAMSQWLTHAWFHAEEAWMTDGLATFMQQVWKDREAQGDRNANPVPPVQNDQDLRALALYDTDTPQKQDENSNVSSSQPVERVPLTRCSEPICYRTKGAAVWKMLRFLVGDEALQQALQSLHTKGEANAEALEDVLEKISGKDLAWFFEDWVFHDRGLPDLSIVAIAPRSLDGPIRVGPLPPGAPPPPLQDKSKPNGWMVAVEVRNDGGAVAEVPVMLHGSGLSSVNHLRIPAHSVATVRVVVPALPDSVQVNDGTVPEVGANIHTRAVSVDRR